MDRIDFRFTFHNTPYTRRFRELVTQEFGDEMGALSTKLRQLIRKYVDEHGGPDSSDDTE